MRFCSPRRRLDLAEQWAQDSPVHQRSHPEHVILSGGLLLAAGARFEARAGIGGIGSAGDGRPRETASAETDVVVMGGGPCKNG
jgi:hypothetical protein